MMDGVRRRRSEGGEDLHEQTKEEEKDGMEGD